MLLGLAYQQRARETGDPSYYTKSDGVLHRALALDSKDYLAVGGLGSLALSRHRFRDALALGEQATELEQVLGPDVRRDRRRLRRARPLPRGLRGLRHDEHSCGRSLSSYARVSYGRELIGHTARARSRR